MCESTTATISTKFNVLIVRFYAFWYLLYPRVRTNYDVNEYQVALFRVRDFLGCNAIS